MWRLVALALALSFGVAAAAPPPVDAFFSKRIINGAAISPSGRYVAFLQQEAKGAAVTVLDRESGALKPVLPLHGEQFSFNAINWKGEDRLIVGVTVLKLYRVGDNPTGTIQRFKYGRFVVSVDREGQHPVVLFRDDPASDRKASDYVSLIDILDSDPDHVMATAPMAGGFGGMQALWKVDIHSGAAQLIEQGDATTNTWVTDSFGAPVLRSERRPHNWILQTRPPGQNGWTEYRRLRVGDARELQQFEVMGSGPKPGQLYVAVTPANLGEGETRNLHLFDATTQQMGPALWPPLKYDLSTIVQPNPAGEVAAVCYLADTQECQFKDKAAQASYDGLKAFFEGGRNIDPISFSKDGRLWLLRVSGPDEPGAYYLYDSKEHHVDLLGDARPDLANVQLAKMERYVYRSRDGASIPAYLTAPSGAAGPMPLIVMPHGGPERRDSFDYDETGQLLASRGYLVLQPNFRGSGGYGLSYARAGYDHWDRMEDDITDGVRALIKDGRADPNRICILGYSFGGYSALYGGATQPDLYRCVVSVAGVSNLMAMLRLEHDLVQGEVLPSYKYWLESIGDPDTEKSRIEALSPINHAKAFKAPVLLYHGDVDDVVDVDQSRSMERALKGAGKDVRLVVFKGEDHPSFVPEHMIQAFNDILAFIDAHIGAGAKPAASASAH